MNETIKQLYERKSVRAYESRPVPPEIKKLILEAALQAPTAGNMSLYTILDITDQNVKEKLAITCDNQPFIAEAPLVLIFCADYHRWYELFCKHVGKVRTPAEGDLLLANADAIIAAQNAVVAAESLGLGSCYIGDITENYEIHKKLLKLPEYVVPACMLCFGYPTEQQKKRVKPGRFKIEEMVHENGYDESKAAQMELMLQRRNASVEPEGSNDETLSEWIKRFCKRKWNSDFSVEMSRSCRALIDDWCKK
ncbi:MAG: nitroreductase family protein [Anaerovoracaceae bacterium]